MAWFGKRRSPEEPELLATIGKLATGFREFAMKIKPIDVTRLSATEKLLYQDVIRQARDAIRDSDRAHITANTKEHGAESVLKKR